jgi:hypothetical protein
MTHENGKGILDAVGRIRSKGIGTAARSLLGRSHSYSGMSRPTPSSVRRMRHALSPRPSAHYGCHRQTGRLGVVGLTATEPASHRGYAKQGEGGGATYHSGGSMVRWRERFGAARFIDDEVPAVVVGGRRRSLSLWGGKGEVSHWSIEKGRERGRCSPSMVEIAALQRNSDDEAVLRRLGSDK